MGGYTVLYRGSLKSCNYHCSYCPFSKRSGGDRDVLNRELRNDRKQWFSFVKMLLERVEATNIRALMVTPYGEAMIHPWYWEGLAQLSRHDGIDAAGAQTNASFSIEPFFELFQKAGGKPEKLRLWATFHPEMTSVSAFAEKCTGLWELGVQLCAGAVGAPENMELLKQLRKELPEGIYLWINRMDGMRRAYTPKETSGFSEIDPYFYRELLPHPANEKECAGRMFLEADGRIRTCNIAPVQKRGLKEVPVWETLPAPVCGRKRCSCYLAYGGRDNLMNQALFGPYPLFRIPRRPKAVFFDIMGTLVSDAGASDGISAETVAGLSSLKKEGAVLLFATTLPYGEAVRRCRNVRSLFCGGIFAAGAHLFLEKDGKTREYFYYLDDVCLSFLKPLERKYGCRILTLKNGGRCYKITLLRAHRKPWREKEARELFEALPEEIRNGMRYLIEENCLQMVSAYADKAGGVKKLCEWLCVSPEETYAAGDSAEDVKMMELCGSRTEDR